MIRTDIFLIPLFLAVFFLYLNGVFGISLDYHNYEVFYNHLNEIYQPFSTRFEFGFYTVSYIYKNIINDDWLSLSAIICLFTLCFKYFYLRVYNNIFLVVIYLVTFFPLYEFTQIRMSLAISFIFIALYFDTKDKKHSSLFYFFIAVSFQYTSMIFLVTYIYFLLFKENLKLKNILFVSLISASLILIIISLLEGINPHIKFYLQTSQEINILSVRMLLCYLTVIYCLINYKNFNRHLKLLTLFFFINISCVISLIDYPVIAFRLLEVVLFIPFIFISLSKSKIKYGLILFSFYIYYREYINLDIITYNNFL
ncbi:TPA: EpsG family protein [Photobacterium damselae]